LPRPRGPLSTAIIEALSERPPARVLPVEAVAEADPYGDDLALGLYTCYELHYRGFRAVAPGWEWDPELVRLRNAMEARFLRAVRSDVPGGTNLDAALDALLEEPVPSTGASQFLREKGEWWHMREYIVHRSMYHLKEADPHAWVIPRLQGQAKASLVAVEYDEFGGGRGDRMHAQLFADLMAGMGLDARYLYYLDDVPAPALAIVDLMSMLGLHRAFRGALVGHFTAAEITTAPSARRMAEALERLGAAPVCTHFYTEHIEADAVHEQVMRRDVVGDLLDREPHLAADVLFGIQATELLEARFERHVLGAWNSGESSLLRPVT
ncbi:MAG TPA: iron-containing redox enzyme family protein, partial [Actinopolymorphaceae bacterium]